MKKIIGIIVVALIAAGAVYAMKDKKAAEPVKEIQKQESGSNQAADNIAPTSSGDMTEDKQNASKPENTSPVQDVMDDVDIPPAETKVFAVTGQNFSFSSKEIRVQKGDRVRINFSTPGGNHSWVIDEFNAKTERLAAGGSESVEFIADKTGTFEYYCSVGAHRSMGMTGNLIVE